MVKLIALIQEVDYLCNALPCGETDTLNICSLSRHCFLLPLHALLKQLVRKTDLQQHPHSVNMANLAGGYGEANI